MDGVKPRILCVDDEPLNLKLLEALLIPEGYDVIKADNGRKALELLQKERVDVVLLDIMMPEMNGFDVCRKIKNDERLRSIPVVVLTSLTSKEDRIRAIDAGAEDFISKPFDQIEVLTRIRMLYRVKSLNDRLNSAYRDVKSLTSFGEYLVTTIDPERFNFSESIRELVKYFLRTGERGDDRPEYILVGYPEEQDYQYILYAFSAPERYLNEVMSGLEGVKGKGFFNKDSEDPFFKEIVRRLRGLDVWINNMVISIDDAVSIFFMNYPRPVSEHDISVLDNFNMQCKFYRNISERIRDIDSAFRYTVFALARAAEANDEDTGNHIIKVGEYCAILSEGLGMDKEFISTIRLQATLHDVGKVHIHPDILKKPGKLTPDEWEIMKTHTIMGAKIIGEHRRFVMAKNICLCHHERWDGGGYPRGLKGEEIPLEARIMSIADQYDALRNPRVYKPAFDHDLTYRIITEGDGRTMPQHFDPLILNIFKERAREFRDVYESLKG